LEKDDERKIMKNKLTETKFKSSLGLTFLLLLAGNLIALVFAAPASAQTFGTGPSARLLQGSDGALYGTTYSGGGPGSGTVFKLNPEGSGFTVLHDFDGTTGANPYAGLIEAGNGALYGTARFGGSSGNGNVFKLNRDGAGFTVIYDFDFTTGSEPYAAPTEGSDGVLYGTAAGGGSNNYGTVFKLNPDGSDFSVLMDFEYTTTGGSPVGELIQGTDGALYGTATQGGSSGYGTVFKLNTDGTGFTVLHEFDFTTGAYPFCMLMQGPDETLYGTARDGGSTGYGTVFKLNPDGTGFTVLHEFDGTTGANPYAGLVQGGDGALYGTATQGGSGGYGTVFKLNTDGNGFTVLLEFESSTTGANPNAGLIQGADGALYGAAPSGGNGGGGTVFRLNEDGTDFTVSQSFCDPGQPSYSAQVQPPINPDGSSVFTFRRGVVPVKFRLTECGGSTCTLPPAAIAVTRTAGGVIGEINESVYSSQADSGSNFRIEGCQYHYNLNSSALGVGTYRVDILIGGQVVGSASFKLK
jgi:uncharacterized repeat protein (TIGR03803 family)